MLARLVRDLPEGDVTYEPKWDGFRCLVFVAEHDIDLRSRHDRPLARYFPELVSAIDAIRAGRSGGASERGWVMDGEILLAVPGDFSVLMSRLHPAASRVERLARETPARYVAFDLLADGSCDVRDRPFTERRAALERVLPPRDATISVTPATRDPAVAPAGVIRSSHVGRRSVIERIPEVASRGFRRAVLLVLSPAARGATTSWSDAGGVLGPTAFLLVGSSCRSGAASHRIDCGAVELAASRPD